MFPRLMMTVAILLPLLAGAAARAQDPAKEKQLADKAWEVLGVVCSPKTGPGAMRV